MRKHRFKIKAIKRAIMSLAVFCLSMLMVLTSMTMGVSANNDEVYFNDDMSVVIKVDRTQDIGSNNLNLDFTVSNDENITVEDIQIKGESIKNDAFLYSHAVGENGNFKFSVITTRIEQVENESEEMERIVRHETFLFTVSVDEIEEIKEDSQNETQIQVDNSLETDVSEEQLDPTKLVETDKESNVSTPPQDSTNTGTEVVEENEKTPEIKEFKHGDVIRTLDKLPNMNEIDDVLASDEIIVVINETGEIQVRKNVESDSIRKKRAANSVTLGEFIATGLSFHWRANPSYAWNLPGGMHEYFVNGEVAFCIEPSVQNVATGNATSTELSLINEIRVMDGRLNFMPSFAQRDKIELISNYGYKYPNHQTKAFKWATQKLIFEELGWVFTASSPNVSAEEQIIKNLVASHTERPVWHGEEKNVRIGDIVDLSNPLNPNFVVYSHEGLEIVEDSGTSLKVKVIEKNALLIMDKKRGSEKGTSYVYTDGSTQRVVDFKLYDPVDTYIEFNVQSHEQRIRKLGENNEPLANHKFRMSYSNTVDANGLLVDGWDYVTGADGYTPYDTWNDEGRTVYVQEIEAKAPYVNSKEIKTFVVTAGATTTLTFTNSKAVGQASITKYAKGTNTTISGTVYDYVNTSTGNSVERLTTNAQGIATTSKHPLGDYHFVEVFVPAPYVLNSTPITANLNYKDQHTAVVSVAVRQENDVAVGRASITKTEKGTSTTIAGVIYDYVHESGRVVESNIITNAQGIATTKTHPLGNYHFVEKFTPIPYILNTTPVPANLVYKDQHTAVVSASVRQENIRAVGQIEIIKLDEHGKPLAGVTFNVLNASNTIVATLVTGTNGRARTKDLPLGTYRLQEVSVPNGIVLDKTHHEVVINYANQTTAVVLVSKNITNYYRDFDVTLTKVEDNSDKFNPELHGQTITGVELGYYAQSNIYEGSTLRYLAGELVGKLVTNAAGQVKFENLPAGDYRIKELATAEGYQLFEGYWDMSVQYTGTDASVSLVQVGKTLTNTPIYGGVELVKANGTATLRLEGAEFELYYKDKLLGTYTSDKDGRIVVDGLRYSTGNAYKFVEVKSPWGYWINEAPIFFDITTQGEIKYLIAPNNLIEVHVEGNKTNEDLLPLEGVGFSIRNFETKEIVTLQYADGREVKEESVFYTDEKGNFFTRGMLTAGEYELIEVAPLEGYQPIDPKRFTVDENQSYIDLGSLIGLSLDIGDIVNYWNRGDIKIGKLDPELNIYLPNFGFNLYDINNNLLGYYETDEDGFVTIPNLKYGLYDIEEIKVDGEYLLNPSQKRERIFVEEHEKTYTVIFENVQPKGKLEGLKLDYKDNTGVQGAEYGLYTLEDELEQSAFTDADGHFLFEGFRLGKYYVQEIATVDGYRIDDTKYYVDFEYADEHTPIILQTLTVKEMRVPEIGTTASFVERDIKEPNIVTLVDKVRYENLLIGKEYTSNATLMNPVTGQAIIIDGKEVTGSTTFIADKHDGFVEVSITFDASKLETKTVVFFEDLLEEGTPIAFHHDLKDKDQTVEIPEIGTKASFTERDKVEPNIVSLTDTVSYTGLVVGKEYTSTAVLMNPVTGQAIIIDGKEVTGSTTFTPTETSGTVDVVVTFDINKLETKKVVFFETVSEEDRLVALHTDINDVNQTVEIPEIGTTVSFKERDTKEPNIVTLTDEVRYSGLVIGKVYTVEGKLMDGLTGEALIIDGKEVTGATTFTATEKEGSVNVTFTFDQNKLTTEKIVVFEELYEEDRLIAVHADLEDVEQTIEIITLQINKIGRETKERLLDAEFTMSDMENNVLDVQKTNKEGIAEFKVFYGEVVQLKETGAPEGYLLSDEVVTVDTTTIESGTLYTIEYFNDLLPIVELPPTGMNNTALLLALFITVLGIALLLVVKAGNRKSEIMAGSMNVHVSNISDNFAKTSEPNEVHGKISMYVEQSEKRSDDDFDTRTKPKEE